MRYGLPVALLLVAACGGGSGGAGSGPPGPLPGAPSLFVNWENLSVHPLDLTPDGLTLLACNTPDARLEILDVSSGAPVPAGSVSVGLDPLSVRARTPTEAWVVNHISDSVSVVDLPTRRVVATLATLDEPCDVVFAGGKAYVSCSQSNAVQVFDPLDLSAAPLTIPIEGEDPRALAASPDGREVYVAVFESGNGTTALGGGMQDGASRDSFPPNVVNDPEGPHGGANPPPNAGLGFDPPIDPALPPPPPTSLIVRRDALGRWRDDTGAEWTEFVSGSKAARSGRRPGWRLVDHDVAVIDTATSGVRYVERCMNLCMAIAVRADTGELLVAGTDATNEVRFEPRIAGRFLRVVLAAVGGGGPAVVDLNLHLGYATATIPASDRDLSLGDPRGIAWDATRRRGYVTGMGSNNVAVVDAGYDRVGLVEVGEGPTGIVLSADGATGYVLNRFEGSISTIDTAALREMARLPLFDPTPGEIKRGRRHLYGTHETSGSGHLSCASCHVDARTDRLAWDLGDPAGGMRRMDQNCLTGALRPCEDFHPMKGPMLTQTLQDIIGKEPFHWRGDRAGLEEFADAFVTLLGDDETLAPGAMREFEDFLATIHLPPNPFRELDNSLPVRLPLPGHVAPGRFGPEGTPLPDGNAQEGLRLYRMASLDGGVPGFQCVTCHTLPVGVGPDFAVVGGVPAPLPPGPDGQRHHALVSVDGLTNVSLKVPQLRTLYDRVGLDMTRDLSLAGFGFLHDGTVDSLARFVAEPLFAVSSDKEIADLVAFLLCFSGSDLPTGSIERLTELPGPPGRDTHAAVGVQRTIASARPDPRLAAMRALADAGAVDLIAKGQGRGWHYDASRGILLSDRNGETHFFDEVRGRAASGGEITYTLVPKGCGRRLGIDRDDDAFGDATEADSGTDPADPLDFPR